jgi:hypothetical protein
MKKYNRFIVLGIIISLLLPAFVLSKGKYEERDLLIGILEGTGATFAEGDINLGGTIMDRFIGEKEIENISNEVREELGIRGKVIKNEDIEKMDLIEGYYLKDMVKEDGFIQLMVQGFDDYENFITFILSSYDNIDGGSGETSLFINLIKRAQFVEINDIIEKVESLFNEYDKPVNITTCIIGTFDGDINLEEKEKRILNVTKLVKGKIVERYSEDDILSFSIYTPYIEEYIYTGNKKMNLNIATRYNEYENKTYIWIGTPIITIGY